MFERLELHWNTWLILVSYFVSVQASYTAVLFLQMRFSKWFLFLAAACLSLSGIWSMHFIGMAAMHIHTRVTYNVGWTIGSAFLAFVSVLAAFFLLNARIGKQVDINRTSYAAHKEALQDAPHSTIALSATLVALGVCAMHYTGMHAMECENVTKVINWGVVFASCFIALFAAAAALYFAFVLPITRRFTVPTALVCGVAVTGMHYTGMYGIHYDIDPLLKQDPYSSIEDVVVYIVFFGMMLSTGALAFSSFMYRRKLNQAADSAQRFADVILAGRFKELTVDSPVYEVSATQDEPMIQRIKASYRQMGIQINTLKSFMPASLLAQFEDSVSSGDGGSPTMSSAAASSTQSSPNLAQLPWLGDEQNSFSQRRCTILVFSALQLPNDVNELSAVVKQFMSAVADYVGNSDGVIEQLNPKYTIVSFNAHKPCHQHADKAVRCALQVLQRVPGAWTAFVDSATNFVGTCGFSSLSSRVVLGETLYLAPWLITLARGVLHVRILLTERSAQLLDQSTLLPLDVVEVPWSTLPKFKVYTAFRVGRPEFQVFRQAFTALSQMKLQEATAFVESLPASRQTLELGSRIAFLDSHPRQEYCRHITLPWETFGLGMQGSAAAPSPSEAHTGSPTSESSGSISGFVKAAPKQKKATLSGMAATQLAAARSSVLDDTVNPDEVILGASHSRTPGNLPLAKPDGASASGESTFETADPPLFPVFSVFSVPTVEDIPKRIQDIYGATWIRADRRIGSGANGMVYSAIGHNGTFAAIKFVPLYVDVDTADITQELETVTTLQHENIVAYFSCAVCPRHFGFFMEYVAGGSLRDLTLKFGELPLPLCRRIIIDILRGLSFLHEHGIVHCDIKPDNVLVTTEGVSKLADFGSSLMQSAAISCREVSELRGTPAYIAPEVAQGHAPQKASDIWSFGILVYEMFSNLHPYGPLTTETSRSLFLQKLNRPSDLPPVHYPPSIPPEVKGLIEQCLNIDPSARPSADQLGYHPFLL